MKTSVLPPSPRFRFRLAKTMTIGAIDGSIIAAIMMVHMTMTASQFAADQSDIGMASSARGLSMWTLPQLRTNQGASAGAQTAAAVHACAPISLRGNALKSGSGLVGERSKEGVPARDVAGDPVIVYLQARRAGDDDRLAWRNGQRMPLDFRRSAALALDGLELR